jgi:lipopolysaccharide biosynthesis glycosyltransferase
MKNNLVVTLADSNYFDQARQVLSSVYFNSGWKGDYMVLAHDMKDEQVEWFNDRGIIVKKIGKIGKTELPNHPGTVLGKFHLFESDMNEWNRIIYLDADISVTASLDRLTEMKGFWAAVDFHDMKLRGQFKKPQAGTAYSEEREAYDILSRHYDMDKISFNSGVMAFDGEFADETLYRNLLELYNDYKSVTLHDQSILNLLFYENWNRLPLAYNNYFLYSRKPWSIRFHKCDGIVNHYILDRVWKTKNLDHYPVWKENLEKSEYIDLERRPIVVRSWDEDEIDEVSDKLETCTIRNDTIQGKILLFATSIDRGIGKIGLKLRKISPKFYSMIRKEKEQDKNEDP